ncbi:MAG: hypothetical protein WAW17_15825, partial [Rhodococcus sp. (in: high G+C Gram-positive bacteria)]
MTTLSQYVRARPRFSRSANVERDHGSRAVEGYVPTGRAIDVVGRIARGLSDPAAGRAFSITGPHGGGKSSLAVFLDGLLSAESTRAHSESHTILRMVDEVVDNQLVQGLQSVGAQKEGMIRAFATAKAEPVSATIARALHSGAERTFGATQTIVPRSYSESEANRTLTTSEIRDTIKRMCATRPMILIIDEFGKNLEAYAESGHLGDPYLLQELAESTQGKDPLPLVIITMQHLSFEEYVQETSAARRREWSKVQGRFQDIPYVETSAQSRRLMIASLDRRTKKLDSAAAKWIKSNQRTFEDLGLRDLVEDASAAIPLHPLT